MASGDNDDGHVVEVVLSGASVTRWVPDDDGGVDHLEDTGWEVEDVVEVRCSCGRRYDTEKDALRHLRDVATGRYRARRRPCRLLGVAEEDDDGPICGICREMIQEAANLAYQGEKPVHQSCMAAQGGEEDGPQ